MRCVLVWSSCLLACLFGACAPEGSSAYVSYNVPLDSECEASPGATEFLYVGLYDIADGGDWEAGAKSTFCRNSYYLHLIVNSSLKSNASSATGRAEPNVLQVTDAEVTLIDIEKQGRIPFNDGLPNPFRVKTNNTLAPTTGNDPTTGVIAVEAIPVGYHSQLSNFVGSQLLAEVQVFGTTTGDVDIDFKPFSFPIRICEGCLKRCLSTFGEDPSEDEIYGEECADNAGADGRVCADPTCPSTR